MAVPSKTHVCRLSLAGFAGSNPSVDLAVCALLMLCAVG